MLRGDFSVIRKFIVAERCSRAKYLHHKPLKRDRKIAECNDAIDDLKALAAMDYGADACLFRLRNFLREEKSARDAAIPMTNYRYRLLKLEEADQAMASLAKIERYWTQLHPELAEVLV